MPSLPERHLLRRQQPFALTDFLRLFSLGNLIACIGFYHAKCFAINATSQ
jgi:hypothetical protein